MPKLAPITTIEKTIGRYNKTPMTSEGSWILTFCKKHWYHSNEIFQIRSTSFFDTRPPCRLHSCIHWNGTCLVVCILSSFKLECFLQGNKNDLTTRLLLTEEDVNRDLSNLTLVGPETQARLEALLAAAGKCFNDKGQTKQIFRIKKWFW